MEELLKDLRRNRNYKYYSLLLTFINLINQEVGAKVRLTVDEIIKEVDISRPTFYSYYESAQEFYVDLMEILATIWPQYMTKKSLEMQQPDFLELAFSFKIGIAMSNLKKIAGKFPEVKDPWNQYFKNSTDRMGQWYMATQNMDEGTAQKTARFVLNELILHDDLYYEDFNAYKALMQEQKTV